MAQQLNHSEMAGFARHLASSFTKGTLLVEALTSMEASAESPDLKNAIRTIRSQVMQGMQLNYCMRQTEIFPEAVIDQVAKGEKQGVLDVTFRELAEQFEQRNANN